MSEIDRCKKLWTEVLAISLEDAAGQARAMEGNLQAPVRMERKRLRDEATHWLEGNELWPGSFRWVCMFLDLDHQWVRDGFFKNPREIGARLRQMFVHRSDHHAYGERG